MAKPTDPRAPTTEEQHAEIERLILSGEYHGAKTRTELAAKWGVSPRTVSNRAAEVNAAIQRATPALATKVADAVARLQAVGAMALSRRKGLVIKDKGIEYVDDPDLRTARECIEAEMRILGVGVGAAQKTDLSTSSGIAANEDPKSVRAKLVAAIAECDREIVRREQKDASH